MKRRALLSHAAAAVAICALGQAIAAPSTAETEYQKGIAALCGRHGPVDLAAAARHLEAAAEGGHAGAQSLLGWMAMSGTGMARDPGRAARWLTAAAERGDKVAQNNLGILYALGEGVPHDHSAAAKWFRAAAAQGAADAARNLRSLQRGRTPGASAPEGLSRVLPATGAAAFGCGKGRGGRMA